MNTDLVNKLVRQLNSIGVEILEDVILPGEKQSPDRLVLYFKRPKDQSAWMQRKYEFLKEIASLPVSPEVHLGQQEFIDKKRNEYISVGLLWIEGGDAALEQVISVLEKIRAKPITAISAVSEVYIGGNTGLSSKIKSGPLSPSEFLRR